MSEKETSIHPLVQLTLKNIDFDLSFELQQFENSKKKSVESLAVIEPSSLPQDVNHQPIDYNFVSSHAPEDDHIPVASRIINDKYNLKEIIFTPWAIFGLIIFIATNALIFVNWDFNSQPQAQNDDLIVEEIDTEPENPSTDSPEEIITSSQEEINLELPSPPNLPSPLPQENTVAENNTENQNLYPDLKTALLSEAVIYLAESNPPSASPTNGIPNTPGNTGNSPRYHIITDYKSPEHFAQVREKIPNAVVTNVNQEIKIQLGVFNDNSEAQQQAQRLQQAEQLPITVIATYN